jgi:Outer membrane efflux protein
MQGSARFPSRIKCAFGSVGGSLGRGGLLLSGTAAARGRQVLGGSGVRLLHGLGAYLWAIAGIAVAAVGLASRPAAADTLEWALVQAYQNNPSLNAQRAALRATDENVPQALSGYRPKLSVTGSGGYHYVNAIGQLPANGQVVNVPFAQTFYPRIVSLYSKKSS